MPDRFSEQLHDPSLHWAVGGFVPWLFGQFTTAGTVWPAQVLAGMVVVVVLVVDVVVVEVVVVVVVDEVVLVVPTVELGPDPTGGPGLLGLPQYVAAIPAPTIRSTAESTRAAFRIAMPQGEPECYSRQADPVNGQDLI